MRSQNDKTGKGRTGRTGKAVLDSQNRTTRTEQLGQNS